MLLTVGVTTLAVVFFGGDIVNQLGVPELASYLWLIPLGVLGLAFYEAINQWAIRQKAFLAIAQTTAARGFVQTGTHLVFGFTAAGPFGLLLGQFFGQWVGAGKLLRRLRTVAGRRSPRSQGVASRRSIHNPRNPNHSQLLQPADRYSGVGG